MFFLKLFALAIVISLLAFALNPSADLLFLLKSLALCIAIAIIITFAYPLLRGVQGGDNVTVVANSTVPSLFGRGGIALNGGRKNGQVRIKLDDGREAVGIIESYEGMLSLPRVRLVYEEKLVE
jgi:hypothetical protein